MLKRFSKEELSSQCDLCLFLTNVIDRGRPIFLCVGQFVYNLFAMKDFAVVPTYVAKHLVQYKYGTLSKCSLCFPSCSIRPLSCLDLHDPSRCFNSSPTLHKCYHYRFRRQMTQQSYGRRFQNLRKRIKRKKTSRSNYLFLMQSP